LAQGIIITIDGPAGSGKSTVGRFLAQALGYPYLDSGALYRAVAREARRQGLDLDDGAALAKFLVKFLPRATSDARGFHLWVDGREITGELRTPEVSRDASRVAIQTVVRQWVTGWLRAWADAQGVVAEGRDLGSVVFPDAQVKFYLDAALQVRAERRRQEWQDHGSAPALEKVAAEIAGRDHQDQTRAEAPLKIPDGAIRIDTSKLGPEEVGKQCLAIIQEVLGTGRWENKPSKPV
jgi:cytidylate kinase